MHKVSAVVLAAGASRRFGAENKLLQPFGSSTVVGTVVSVLRHAGLPVLLVTGHESDRVLASCPDTNAVVNPEWEQGMGTGLALAASNVPAGSAILVALGDMPDLSAEVVRALIRAHEGNPKRVVVPEYSAEPGRWGHPVLFGSAYREALRALSGDRGAQSLVRSAKELVIMPVHGALGDIDSVQDLAESQSRLSC